MKIAAYLSVHRRGAGDAAPHGGAPAAGRAAAVRHRAGRRGCQGIHPERTARGLSGNPLRVCAMRRCCRWLTTRVCASPNWWRSAARRFNRPTMDRRCLRCRARKPTRKGRGPMPGFRQTRSGGLSSGSAKPGSPPGPCSGGSACCAPGPGPGRTSGRGPHRRVLSGACRPIWGVSLPYPPVWPKRRSSSARRRSPRRRCD